MSDLPAGAVRRKPLCLLAALPLVLGACDDFIGGRVCTAHVEPGIVVTITDSASGEPRAADAVALARDGAFVDTLGPAHSRGGVLLSRQGAHERKGIYEVTVRVAGYRDWVRSGVLVRPGECHVQRVELEAPLQVATP